MNAVNRLMAFDARTRALIEDVRLLAREWYCPQDLPEIARTNDVGCPTERYQELRNRLNDARYDGTYDKVQGALRSEATRVYYIRETIREIDKSRRKWSEIVPSGVEEMVRQEDTLFVLDTLCTITDNILCDFPLDTRVDVTMLWLLDNTTRRDFTTRSENDAPGLGDITGVTIGTNSNSKGNETDFENDVSPPKPKRPRGAISQVKMAELCGVSSRTIQNWEKGENKPRNYPGREDSATSIIWATGYKQKKRFLVSARAMNRATPVDPYALDEGEHESAFE